MRVLENISKFIGVKEEVIIKRQATAQYAYRRFTIKKRNGGDRSIYHPSVFVKNVQYALMQVFFSKVHLNNAAYGFIRGLKSPLLMNALQHSKFKYSICVDLRDFFLSIRPDDLFSSIDKYRDYCLVFRDERMDSIDRDIIRNYCFVRNRGQEKLAIGSPSSPDISNIVMRVVDDALVEIAKAIDGKYTRYADDIVVSYNKKDIGDSVFNDIKAIVKEKIPNLSINDNKTKFTSKKGRRVITGMVISSDSEVSIGREKKRALQSRIYKYSKNPQEDKEKLSLAGYVAFVRDVDPPFFNKLYCKYGEEVMDSLIGKK